MLDKLIFSGYFPHKNTPLQNELCLSSYKSYSHLINHVRKNIVHCHRIKFPSFFISSDKKALFLDARARGNKSFIYQFQLKESLNPVDEGSLLTVQAQNGSLEFYPEDSRVINYRGILHLVSTVRRGDGKTRQFLINAENGKAEELRCKWQKLLHTEKNWAPFILNNQLHFIYSIDPLRVLRLNSGGECILIHGMEPIGKFDYFSMILRGGSPFMLYEYPYYVGFCRTSYFCKPVPKSTRNLFYSGLHKIFLTVLRVDPFEIAYIAGPLVIPLQLLKCELTKRASGGYDYPIDDTNVRKFDVVNDPTSLCFGSDTQVAYLGIDINASRCILLELGGLNKIMRKVMDSYENKSFRGDPKIRPAVENLLLQSKVRRLMDVYSKREKSIFVLF